MTPFATSAVAARFADYPSCVRDHLLRLRELIFATAAADPAIGALTETLKWNQPAYLTAQTRSGTTIRLDTVPDQPDSIALFVHCQTNLIDTFRTEIDASLHYEGNRAILLPTGEPLPEAALRHCIHLALTYHLRKRAAPLRPIGERIRHGH